MPTRPLSPYHKMYDDAPAAIEALSKDNIGIKGVLRIQRKRIETLESEVMRNAKLLRELSGKFGRYEADKAGGE